MGQKASPPKPAKPVTSRLDVKVPARAQARRRAAASKARPWWRKPAYLAPFVIGAMVLMAFALRQSSESSPPHGGAVGAFVGSDLHSLVVDPLDPRHLYVGGHDSAAASRDGGRTFRQVAGLENTDAMAWSVAANGTDQVVSGHQGLRASGDGGATWKDASGNLPGSDIHAAGVDPSSPQRVWAFLTGRGVFSSSDGGRQWQMAGGASLSLMGPIIVSPGGGRLLAADMSNQSIVRSTDGGRTWSAGGTSMMASWLAVDPSDAQHILAAGNGISESRDGGESWQSVAGSPPSVNTVTIGSGAKAPWYSAALEGDRAVVYQSLDLGGHWEKVVERS